VLLLGRGWQTPHVAAVDRGDVTAHGQCVAVVLGGQVELDDAAEAAGHRRIAAVALAEAQTARGLGQIEREALGGGVKTMGHVADQQKGGRPEGREPEPLRVGRPGVVAQRVDDGVGQGEDGDRLAHGDLQGHGRRGIAARRVTKAMSDAACGTGPPAHQGRCPGRIVRTRASESPGNYARPLVLSECVEVPEISEKNEKAELALIDTLIRPFLYWSTLTHAGP
jgi:hypothetical protein